MRPGRACLGLLALALLAAPGCATYERGRLVGASTSQALAADMTVVSEEVLGRSCGGLLVHRLEHAVDDALAQAPGADALADATFRFERLCLVVRGRAVRAAR